MISHEKENAPLIVRLCHLKKDSKTIEYGFNLRGKSCENCRYIGKVDTNTKADLAGLRSGDKILEINRVNIHKMRHEEIIQLIKAGLTRNGKKHKNEVLFMVIDEAIDEKFRQPGMPVQTLSSNFKIVISSSCYKFKNSDDDEDDAVCNDESIRPHDKTNDL